jgi:uncharacterized alpha-E superfamily protein
MAQPQLASTVQLLVFDESNPRALAFHWRGVRRTLERLAESLGGGVEDSLSAAIRQLQNIELHQLDDSLAVRASLAEALHGLESAAAQLCERLGMRHFSHVGMDVRTVAA